jgi:hypothetical protein
MAKRRKGRRRATRNRLSIPNGKALVSIALLFFVLFIALFVTSDDRSWQEYIDAGQRAQERGNYAWAEKMYREALQYAEEQDANGPMVRTTWRHLRRLEQIRSQPTP